MLRRRAVPSPDQGSHSFSQIENQPWGSRPLIEAASDCCCSNYSCVVPLGPAGPCRTHSPALNSGLRTIAGGGGRRGRAYRGSCWGLSEPSKCTGSDHGVTDVEAKLRPSWGIFHSRARGGEMAQRQAGHGSFMLLELKGKVWRVGGGAGEADGWLDGGGA